MVIPAEWIEHRRQDGEPVGWIVPDGEFFSAVDVMGRTVATGLDWVEAEEALEERGLSFLAERHTLTLPDGSTRPVRISQLSPESVTVVADEFGAASAVGAHAEEFHLPFPVPEETLREGTD